MESTAAHQSSHLGRTLRGGIVPAFEGHLIALDGDSVARSARECFLLNSAENDRAYASILRRLKAFVVTSKLSGSA